MYLVLIAAILPALIMLYYIYNKDKAKPEPTRLLLKGFGLGILSVFVSLFFSVPMGVLGFYNEMTSTLGDAIRTSFFAAAIPEELAKWLMLLCLLKRNPFFDEHMDGIVYAVAVSMGFAALENVTYLFSNIDSWQSVGITRALVSVPAHYAFAVFMGYYYSLYCFGVPSRKIYYGVMTIIAPVLWHGIFDSLLFMMPISESMAFILFVVFCVFCYYMHKFANQRIKNHVDLDTSNNIGEV